MAINQVIYCVREGPFSIEFMTCCKKQMLQRYWKFAGYIIIWRERATVKSRGAVLHNDSTASWYVKMRWPHWTAPRLWQNPYYTCILSHDYSPQIMFWWSDSSKTKEAALIIWHFSGQEKKKKMKRKTASNFFYNWLFFFHSKTTIIFLIAVVFLSARHRGFCFVERLPFEKCQFFFHAAAKYWWIWGECQWAAATRETSG